MRLAVFVCLLASPAWAYEDTTKVAVELGSVLGSEVACGLSLNLEAVGEYVKVKVDPAEMSFANALTMMAGGTEVQIAAKTPAALAAHCEAIRAAAAHHGLLD